MKIIRYISLKKALAAHAEVLDASGGLEGVKNQGAVESILMHIRNDTYYPTFEEKMTHLVFSIIKHHPFNDGNKRTSIALGALFLIRNRYPDEVIARFIVVLEDVVVAVADNAIDKHALQRIISGLLH